MTKFLFSLFLVVTTLMAVACAKFQEQKSPEAESTVDIKNDLEISNKNIIIKSLQPTTKETPAIRQGDQVIASPDGMKKLLLHSFTIENSAVSFDTDSSKIKFSGTANFFGFRNLDKYNFDLKGKIRSGKAILYPSSTIEPDKPRVFAVVFCNHLDSPSDETSRSKIHSTCDSFFIDVYLKFSQYENELFDEQVKDCGPKNSCLNYKGKVAPIAAVADAPAKPSEPLPLPVGVTEPEEIPRADTPTPSESSIFENEEEDVQFSPGGFKGFNQPVNVKILYDTADSVGGAIPLTSSSLDENAKPHKSRPPQKGTHVDSRKNLEFPLNVVVPEEGHIQQVNGTQVKGSLKNATELNEPGLGEIPSFTIDDNTKSFKDPKKRKSYGTFYTVDFVRKMADFSFNLFKVPMRINDLSQQNGGYLWPHSWHRIGLDVDVEYASLHVNHELSTEERWILFQVISSSDLVNQILMSPETKMAVLKLAEARQDNDSKTKQAFRKMHAECDHPTHFHINFNCAYNHICDQDEVDMSSRYVHNQADTYAILERLSRKCAAADAARARK